ncbi:hypothetical protein MED121_16944 [Marinomonas sp. MED121]|nr:hypothetical protein MED121_16944 [Marinomonas sp. MED121]
MISASLVLKGEFKKREFDKKAKNKRLYQ